MISVDVKYHVYLPTKLYRFWLAEPVARNYFGKKLYQQHTSFGRERGLKGKADQNCSDSTACAYGLEFLPLQKTTTHIEEFNLHRPWNCVKRQTCGTIFFFFFFFVWVMSRYNVEGNCFIGFTSTGLRVVAGEMPSWGRCRLVQKNEQAEFLHVSGTPPLARVFFFFFSFLFFFSSSSPRCESL